MPKLYITRMGIRFEAMMMVGVWKPEFRVHRRDLQRRKYMVFGSAQLLNGTQKCPDGALSAILGQRWETTTIASTVHVLTIKYDE